MSKMYLTTSEARAKGLPSVQTQLDRYNGAVIEACQPFKVRASCGHIVIRKMREATAGVPYTEDVVLEAPNGRACDACEKIQMARFA
jgi:hypothetical protein